jgi:peptidoglycan/LPS O-acetylase OafA/YrhL
MTNKLQEEPHPSPASIADIGAEAPAREPLTAAPQPKKLKAEILPLTGLRAVAAMWVLFFHCQDKLAGFFEQHPLAGYFFPWKGYLGVDLFFVLSGFVIYYNYAEWFRTFSFSSYARFLWMRLARIYPVHLCILILFAAAVLWMEHRGQLSIHPQFHHKGDFVWNLFLVHSWWIPLHLSWNGPAWSISCEWMAYILFPALIITRFLTRSPFTTVLICLAFLFGMIGALQWLHNDANSKYGMIRIAGEFPAGCCLCYLFRKGVGSRLNWNLVQLGLGAGLVACGAVVTARGWVDYWCVPFLACFVFSLAYQRGLLARFLSSRPLLFGGYISYSLYMTHKFLTTALEKFFPVYEQGSLSVLTDIPVAILFAAVMYYLVEEPSRKKMRTMIP